jgi:hypothetical protein
MSLKNKLIAVKLQEKTGLNGREERLPRKVKPPA